MISNKTIFITILDDNIGNGPGTFSVILSNAVVVPAGAGPGFDWRAELESLADVVLPLQDSAAAVG